MLSEQPQHQPSPHSRDTLLQRLKEDYGFDQEGWDRVLHKFADLSDEHIEELLAPTETTLRLVWTMCNNCHTVHEGIEPTERPEYQAALSAAKARSTDTHTQE